MAQFEATDFTEQEIAVIRTKILADGFSAGTIVLFRYENSNGKAKIVARIASSKGTATSTEELVMTLVDTLDGWKIDELQSDDVRP